MPKSGKLSGTRGGKYVTSHHPNHRKPKRSAPKPKYPGKSK